MTPDVRPDRIDHVLQRLALQQGPNGVTHSVGTSA